VRATNAGWPRSMPLRQHRVLDLTHVWSGPMATRVLTALGAEVIKLENPAKPDMLRGPGATDLPLRYPDFDPGAVPQHRNAWFNTENTGKRAVALDIKKPAGLELARQLAAMSDVVIANYRPGVLDRMGLGYAELQKLREDIVLVEMPGYAPSSPLANAPAFGSQFDANSGAATLTGDLDGPLLTGFALGDPTAGLFAAAAAVTALSRRRRIGAGAHVVLPQAEAMMPLLGEYFLAESLGDPIRETLNADRRYAPNGVYRTADGWLALTVRTDAQWAALASLLDRHDPGISDRYRGAEYRTIHREAIDTVVSVWTSHILDTSSAVQELQTIGVPAAPVANAAAVATNPQLHHAGYFSELTQASTGTYRYPTLPIIIDGVRAAPIEPAPGIGADTIWCLRTLLDLDDNRLAELERCGVIATSHHASPAEPRPNPETGVN
jgi:crotonobetainyl-CoA:carnitine CoA-transferase CaiB-like acyl-CoA transferase